MEQVIDIKELKKRQYLLYVIIMLVLLAVMLVYTIVWCINYKRDYGFFIKTEAVVVEHKTEEGKMYDVLEYYVDDVVFLNTSSYLSKNNIGDKITIYYDETNPSGFITKLDSRRIALPIITTAYGVVSAVLTVMYFMTYYSKKGAIQTLNKSQNKATTSDNDIVENIEENTADIETKNECHLVRENAKKKTNQNNQGTKLKKFTVVKKSTHSNVKKPKTVVEKSSMKQSSILNKNKKTQK
ncbi:MAG: hypothetical protein E7354_00855 [Clostridiales bacterium]|nr:hypothetical protein [Clostridiales bacterium]